MFLAVLNQSTQITAEDVQTAVRTCASQMKLHVAPYWDMVPPSIVYYADEKLIPPGADILILFDSSDQAGALGYHRVTPEGLPYGRAFVSPVLNHGGTPLTGTMSVSAVVSHEVCEWFVDRFLNLWVDGPDGEYPVEICDPVENDAYEINGVSVSNFVTKRYFDTRAPAGTQLDYMGKLTAPFTITPGGYLQVRKAGVVKSMFGARYPEWKKGGKEFPAARSYRRRHG